MLFCELEQRERHSDVVVEVALGEEHTILLLEYSGYEFLGGCLAIGSGDADNGYFELVGLNSAAIRALNLATPIMHWRL